MLSIIIPTHNEENYLPKLLKCIKKQSYKDYEIIIGDAFSTDRTIEIAKNCGCRIVKDAVPNGGPAMGRNNAAKKARGEMLLFLDADSGIDAGFISTALKEIKERNLDVAGTFINPIGNKPADKFLLGTFNLWIYINQIIAPHAVGSGIFCKKRLHDKIKGFDESIKVAEDMDYVKRAGKHGKFRILNKVKLNFSMRRFDNEGRLAVGLKNFFGAVHRIFYGEIRSNILKYNLRYKK